MTNDDIIKNLKRMVKNFPTAAIPHMSDSEKAVSFLKGDIQKQKIKLFQARQTKDEKLREVLVKNAEEMIDDRILRLENEQRVQKKQKAKGVEVPHAADDHGDNNLHYIKSKLTKSKVDDILKQFICEDCATLIGIVCHVVYWAVFGNFNDLQLDSYHQQKLLVSLVQRLDKYEQTLIQFLAEIQDNPRNQEQHLKKDVEEENKQKIKEFTKQIKMAELKQLLNNFIKPFLILIIRFQVELVFRYNYRKFFENKGPEIGSNDHSGMGFKKSDRLDPDHVHNAIKKMNGIITEVLDPNLYYSRISFLESGKEAIDLKYEIGKGKSVGEGNIKLPSISSLFYTRSTLVKNLFETPTDGNIRKRFSDNFKNFKTSIRNKQALERTQQELRRKQQVTAKVNTPVLLQEPFDPSCNSLTSTVMRRTKTTRANEKPANSLVPSTQGRPPRDQKASMRAEYMQRTLEADDSLESSSLVASNLTSARYPTTRIPVYNQDA